MLGLFPISMGRLSLMKELYKAMRESDRRQLIGFSLFWLFALWVPVPGEAVLAAVPFAYDHRKGRVMFPREVYIPSSRKLKNH